MEAENIDWSNIESTFEEDYTYENINAPRWVDLSAPTEPVNDDTWFCNTNCKHAKNVEDFLKPTRNLKVVMKLLRSVDVKRKGKENRVSSVENPKTECLGIQASDSSSDNNENQNPNHSTVTLNIKSDLEKKKQRDDSDANSTSRNDRKQPGLRSTFSARNLVAGRREVVNQITEFCGELKKMARYGLKKKGWSSEKKRVPLLVVKQRERQTENRGNRELAIDII
ncbi:hypothetical protein EZV62_005397 [Acer yangbiense]|uniref:Uncharacterized protein n=1 Tax=Acer yangbiense TaxID=1000413 RepID=A0A5C7IPY2_9ROSI|nr:hypothetical protein EZV62_005397 [Acer yangbiense]